LNIDVKWKEIANYEFTDSANGPENMVRVLWSGNLADNTKARECFIRSECEWNSLRLEDSYLPKYKKGKSWSDSSAYNFTLKEYTLQSDFEVKNKAKEALNKFRQLQIKSAYQSAIKKRLIVDGVHRAVALQLKVYNHENIPDIRLLECYGADVSKSFPCDFKHLV
jgi:hypothetical protein